MRVALVHALALSGTVFNKYRKRKRLNIVVTASNCQNNHSIAIRPETKQHFYQALHQGPMVPRRADHGSKGNQQSHSLLGEGIENNVGRKTLLRINDDEDSPSKIKMLGKSEECTVSIKTFLGNELEYEEVRDQDNWKNVVYEVPKNSDVDLGNLTAMGVLGKCEDGGDSNVYYEERIFRSDDDKTYSKSVLEDEESYEEMSSNRPLRE